MTKVLITGAAGFQAGYIIDRLRETYDLVLFDRAAPRAEFAGLPFISGDITCLADVENALAGCDAVVHLVALVRGREGLPLGAYCDIMVRGTWNVAEACVTQKVRRLVNMSSVVATGWPPSQDHPRQVSDGPNFTPADLNYQLAKNLSEVIGNAYHQAHGLEVIHLRPAIIARDGANPEPQAGANGAGYWFVHVDPADVAQAVEAALAARVVHGTYNIVAGRQDALFAWQPAVGELGYQPHCNWPEIPLDIPGTA